VARSRERGREVAHGSITSAQGRAMWVGCAGTKACAGGACEGGVGGGWTRLAWLVGWTDGSR
jgi:hypothetical protein